MHKTGSVSLVSTLSLLMTACGGGSDNSIDEALDSEGAGGTDSFSQKIVNAQAGTAYLNLASGEVVGEAEEWHLAFNRTTIKVNSGASGSGSVGSVLGDAQAGFYDASGDPDPNVFLNATAGGELAHLKDEFEDPGTWQNDAVVYAFGDAWSSYDYATGDIAEVSGIGYLVRSDEGDSYARMRILDFDFPTREGNGIRSFEIEFEVQASGTTQFSGTTISFTQPVNYDGGDACFDFDSDATVDCTSNTDWDVMVGFSGRAWYLKTNGGPSGDGQGGALGPIDWAELQTYTSATVTSEGASLERAYASDSTGGTFADNSWYAYNLQGAHKLWPNYRVFLINTDTADDTSPVYALQVINYYGEDGVSGQPEVRWKEVSLVDGGE